MRALGVPRPMKSTVNAESTRALRVQDRGTRARTRKERGDGEKGERRREGGREQTDRQTDKR